jgi:uncharacterized protein (TIGR03435 family)
MKSSQTSFRIAFLATLCLGAVRAGWTQPPKSGPKFEVASVRLTSSLNQFAIDNSAALESGGKPVPNGVTFSGSRMTINGLVLKAIIARAYGTDMNRIMGADWTAQTRIVIQALMPQGSMQDQLPEMLKALLAERFHLVAHTTALPEPVYALVTAKNGPKLNPPRELDLTACANWMEDRGFEPVRSCVNSRRAGDQEVRTRLSIGDFVGPTRSEFTNGGSHREFFKTTMQQLVRLLDVPVNGYPDLPVVDKTGIEGAWDFTLDRSCTPGGRGGEGCDSYAAALEKIGLKLEKTTAPVERLVIDQIDKVPTEN